MQEMRVASLSIKQELPSVKSSPPASVFSPFESIFFESRQEMEDTMQLGTEAEPGIKSLNEPAKVRN